MTYLYLVLTTIFWAATFHLAKYALAFMAPLTAGAWRFVLAAVLLLPVVLWRGEWDLKAVRRNAVALVVMGLIGVFGFSASLFFGLRVTSAVNGSLIMGFTPAITALLAALISGERVRPLQMLGFALSFVGVAVIVSQGSLHNLLSMNLSKGDALIFLGSVCWALYGVIPRRFIHDVPPLLLTLATLVPGALALAVTAQLTTGDLFMLPSLPVVLAVLAMSVFGSVLAYLWWNTGIQRIGASRVSVFINLVPVFTAAMGVLMGQTLTVAQLSGAALVITGVICTAGTRTASSHPSSPLTLHRQQG